MPVKKYMELDSNFRDRNMYPNPASFEVGISQYGMKSNKTAVDPITMMYPEIVFSPADFDSVEINFLNQVANNDISDSSSASTFIVEYNSPPTLSGTIPAYVDDYYVGAMLLVDVKHTMGSPPPTYEYFRRILEWKCISPIVPGTTPSRFKVTIEGSLLDATTTSKTSLLIYNPTDFVDPANAYIFIPTSLSIDNYYDKYVLWNQTRNTSVAILSFDKLTHLAKIGDITGLSFATTDVYVIRKIAPLDFGTLQSPDAEYSTIPNAFGIQQRASQTMVNSFIRIYETASQTPLDAATGAVNPSANIIRKIIQVYDYYTDPTTGVVTEKNTIILDGGLLGGIPTDYQYEILDFSIDNYSPFVYTGSQVSQNQPVVHEISLNSLILPNVILKHGGRIAYYPYVYVELENVSSTSVSNKNIIYSNNPHTYRAVFKVPITDLNHPSVSPFVKLTGNGMTQTMTFKQNDNMRVAVKLPDGSLFETYDSDTSYGQEPDPFVQISFCFGMERI